VEGVTRSLESRVEFALRVSVFNRTDIVRFLFYILDTILSFYWPDTVSMRQTEPLPTRRFLWLCRPSHWDATGACKMQLNHPERLAPSTRWRQRRDWNQNSGHQQRRKVPYSQCIHTTSLREKQNLHQVCSKVARCRWVQPRLSLSYSSHPRPHRCHSVVDGHASIMDNLLHSRRVPRNRSKAGKAILEIPEQSEGQASNSMACDYNQNCCGTWLFPKSRKRRLYRSASEP
jgi:hypothetical protein